MDVVPAVLVGGVFGVGFFGGGHFYFGSGRQILNIRAHRVG